MASERWRCPVCKIEAIIDRAKNTKEILLSFPTTGYAGQFPTHFDCELAKSVKSMNFSRLERVS